MLSKLLNSVVRFVKAEDGPTAVEYAVMLALIIVICISSVMWLGYMASDTFHNVGHAAAGEEMHGHKIK